MAELPLLNSCNCGYRDVRQGVKAHQKTCGVRVVPDQRSSCVQQEQDASERSSMADGTTLGGPAPKHMSVKTDKDEEEADLISQSVGEFGRWQLQLTFLLSLFNIPCTWHIFALTFQSLPSDFWCAKPRDLETFSVDQWRNISHPLETKDGKDSYNPCYIWDVDYSTAALSGHKNVSRACTQWQFDTAEVGETITGKLYCREEWKDKLERVWEDPV